MFDWQDLYFFTVLARRGSLSAAARELGVDHTTVGRRVAALESAIGVRLIDRLPRSCPLTDEGVAIAALSGQMEATAHAVLRRARGAASPFSATVRVSAPPAFAAVCIAPYVGEFGRAHRNLKIVLQGTPTNAALDRGEADIAVRLSRPDEKDAVVKKIGVMRFGVYATKDYAVRPSESWQFIAFDEQLDRVPQQVWLKQFLAGRAIAFESSDLFGQLAAAKAGVGVAILPTMIAEPEPSLLRLDVTPAPPERDLWLITYPDLRRSPAVREVMAFLEQCADRVLL